MPDVITTGGTAVDVLHSGAAAVVRTAYGPALDIDEDYLIFDGLEAVQYHQSAMKTVNDAGQIDIGSPVRDIAIPHALRRDVDIRQVENSNGKLRTGDLRFELPVNELGIAPIEGDEIVAADGTRYSVLGYDIATLRTRYRVYARK